jgi:hypothetical protein
MRFSRIFLSLSLLSASALAADSTSISGRYLDGDGDPIDITHVDGSIILKPDPSQANLPPQAKEMLGDLQLKGTLKSEGESFDISAKYEREISPNPNVKLKLKILFDAKGKPNEQGLLMKSCEWRMSMTIFSGGEVAGSENKSEKCVGLWKKQ